MMEIRVKPIRVSHYNLWGSGFLDFDDGVGNKIKIELDNDLREQFLAELKRTVEFQTRIANKNYEHEHKGDFDKVKLIRTDIEIKREKREVN